MTYTIYNRLYNTWWHITVGADVITPGITDQSWLNGEAVVWLDGTTASWLIISVDTDLGVWADGDVAIWANNDRVKW
jgi:hypothetical protein